MLDEWLQKEGGYVAVDLAINETTSGVWYNVGTLIYGRILKVWKQFREGLLEWNLECEGCLIKKDWTHWAFICQSLEKYKEILIESLNPDGSWQVGYGDDISSRRTKNIKNKVAIQWWGILFFSQDFLPWRCSKSTILE